MFEAVPTLFSHLLHVGVTNLLLPQSPTRITTTTYADRYTGMKKEAKFFLSRSGFVNNKVFMAFGK